MGRIRQHVRMSNRFAEYLTGAFEGAPPSLDVAQYDSSNFKEGANRVKTANIRKMFGQMKVGDLVIVPGTIFDPILFGEISSAFDFRSRRVINARQSAREVQFREVEWYRTDVMRADLPRDLQIYLSKPPAIAYVARDRTTENFFHFAYESYIYHNSSFELLRAPKYSGKDPRETEDANRLVCYFIAAYAAMEKNQLEHFVALDFDQAIEDFYDKDFILSYSQVFRSPGQIGLLAAGVLLGAFVSVCTAIAVNTNAAVSTKTEIHIENKGDDPTLGGQINNLEARVNYLISSMGEKQLSAALKKGHRARKNLGLRSKVRIK